MGNPIAEESWFMNVNTKTPWPMLRDRGGEESLPLLLNFTHLVYYGAHYPLSIEYWRCYRRILAKLRDDR